MRFLRRSTDYALRSLVRLAREPAGLSVARLAEEENIPRQFLAKTMKPLRTAGIVRSVRGKRGGFVLAVPPTGLSVARVVEIVQGPIKLSDCGADCPEEDCGLRAPMELLESRVRDAFRAITLAELAEAVP